MTRLVNSNAGTLISTFRPTLLATAILACAVSPSFAEYVTLSSQDNSIWITGELVDFDGTNYLIRSTVGDLTINADAVICEGDLCPSDAEQLTNYTIAGSPAMAQAFLPALFSSYAEANGSTAEIADNGDSLVGVSIVNVDGEQTVDATVNKLGTEQSLAALLNREASFAMVTRQVRTREAKNFEDAGLGVITDPTKEHIIALDALVIVTSENNPVRAITEETAALVFAGQIKNWSQLGGNDAPINVYVRDDNAGTREVFDRQVMRPNGNEITDGVIRVASDARISDAVAADPNGIGFTSFTDRTGAKTLKIEGVCGLQTSPTPFTIKTEEYPLTYLHYMYSDDRSNLQAGERAFLDYVTSMNAQETVERSGFIDQRIVVRSIDDQGLRLASAIAFDNDVSALTQLSSMVRELFAADRLSTTYRFQTASSLLDARASADIDRFADLLRDESFANKEIVLVGFTDSVGDPDKNRDLSERRAQKILDVLLARSPELSERLRFSIKGYGEISPLGCNEVAVGRRINRRVEVWVRDVVSGS